MYDILIKGGTIVDGSGAPVHRRQRFGTAKRADRSRITEPAAQVLSVDGLVVSPGFIDMPLTPIAVSSAMIAAKASCTRGSPLKSRASAVLPRSPAANTRLWQTSSKSVRTKIAGWRRISCSWSDTAPCGTQSWAAKTAKPLTMT